MWVNPKLKDQYNQIHGDLGTPPPERGERILTLDRGIDQLRLVIDEYDTHRYVGLRVWTKNQAGDYFPVKGKGLTIRASELAQVARALEEADMQINHGYGQ